MSLHHIIYQSSALPPCSDQQLRLLLTKARAYNATHDITGVLLYHDGQFVQVLEGEAAAVGTLYESIRRDSRHTSVVKLAHESVATRSFGEWAMAFRPVQAGALAALPGYRDPGGPPAPDAADDSLLTQIVRLAFGPQPQPEPG